MSYFDTINIVSVEPTNENDLDSREVLVTFDDGTEVHICACCESWEQYGAPTEVLWKTVSIAERNNEWLHGIGEFDPDTSQHNY